MKEDAAFTDLIIIPTDFSSASLNASYFALELAAKFKARIKFIHAYSSPDYLPLTFESPESFIGTTLIEIKETAEKNLAKFTEKIKIYSEDNGLAYIPFTSQLFNGEPDEITIYTAEADRAALIIMGISSTLTRSFEPIGRIASHIIDKSPTPILIIPEEMNFNGLDKIHKILYATSFDESDFPAIGKLMNIIRKIELDICCVHIGESEKPWDRIKMNGLKNYFSEVYGKQIESDLIFSRDIMKAMDEYISIHKIDILALSSRKRNLFSKLISPDLTHKVIYHTSIPLLVFRA